MTQHDRRSGGLAAALFAMLGCWPALTLWAQVSFTERAAEHGLEPYIMPVGPVGGIAAADYDNDGDIDLFVPNGSGRTNQLYRNDGSGHFEEVAGPAGLAVDGNHRAALWFDYNGDGLLDLVIGGDCRQDPLKDEACEDIQDLRLFRQSMEGLFNEVTVEAGLDLHWGSWADGHRSGITAGDIDNDGDLDLYVCNWNDGAWLYRNNGDGTFSDITMAAGLGNDVLDYHQPVMHDFNRDGWLDIYQAVDTFTANRLWINQKDGTFVDQAAAVGLDNAMTDMGIALGDYDNDGDIDIHVTNISRNGDHDVLFRNDSAEGELLFTEVAGSEGVAQGYWNWGTAFFDADNDGWLDLAVSNGKNVGQWRFDPSRFFRNNRGDGGTGFTDLSEAAGFDDTLITATLVSLDFDRDGDLDLLQTTSDHGLLRLMENQPTGDAMTHHYLVVRPRMKGSNHFAIGAEVSVRAGELEMVRLIRTATSTLGQEPAEAFFGLGVNDTADEVKVRWPDGTETRLQNVAANQVLDVTPTTVPERLNAGFSDAWYDPATTGQGFFIVVWPGLQQLFLSWFTFDAKRPADVATAALGGPGQRWLTAQGAFSGRRAELDLYSTSGGVFDQGQPSPVTGVVGKMVIEFDDCSSGRLTYELPGPGLAGARVLQRVVPDKAALCEALSGVD